MTVLFADAYNKAHQHGHVLGQARVWRRVEAGAAAVLALPRPAVAHAGRLQVADAQTPRHRQLVTSHYMRGMNLLTYSADKTASTDESIFFPWPGLSLTLASFKIFFDA